MTDVTISVRVGKDLHEQMKQHDEINWSALLRKSLAKKLENLELFDTKQSEKACKVMDTIRKSRIFDKGKKSVEIIREWREKRK